MKPRSLHLAKICCLGLIAFSAGNGFLAAKDEPRITVSAAASLKDALEEIDRLYAREKPGTAVVYNFGGSGALQMQIENGAPVDLFIAAANKQMDLLEKKNLIVASTRRKLLGNDLVLIIPKENDAVKDFKDLASEIVRHVAMGEPKAVPAGAYAQEVLNSLRLWEAVKPKLVFAQDVRQVLTFVASANVDAGFVYATDAKTSAAVKVVAVATADSHSEISYPVAVMANSREATEAKKFEDFLFGEKARAVFAKQGFMLPKQQSTDQP